MGNFIQFDAGAIRELAQILRETDLTEIELVDGEARLYSAMMPDDPVRVRAAPKPGRGWLQGVCTCPASRRRRSSRISASLAMRNFSSMAHLA